MASTSAKEVGHESFHRMNFLHQAANETFETGPQNNYLGFVVDNFLVKTVKFFFFNVSNVIFRDICEKAV